MNEEIQLNKQQTDRIKNLRSKGFRVNEIAKMYGIESSQVSQICGTRKRPLRNVLRETAKELLEEGYSRELIEANFGKAVV